MISRVWKIKMPVLLFGCIYCSNTFPFKPSAYLYMVSLSDAAFNHLYL